MKLILGTRGSALALKQTEQVIKLLKEVDPTLETTIKIIKTLGDSKQGTAEAAISDKQDWIQGLDTALVSGEIDLAVHSAKDVPVEIHPASQIFPLGVRENPADLLIVKNSQYKNLDSLPKGAIIGTASLRRQAQILNYRSDLKLVAHRGNINTRIETFKESPTLSAIVLANAGLSRMTIDTSRFYKIDPKIMLPAVNQGCVVGHIMLHRNDLLTLMNKVIDPEVRIAFEAERQCINLLDANCHSAVGVFAKVIGQELELTCRILMPDGSEKIEASVVGSINNHLQMSEEIAEELVLKGASRIIAESNKLRAGWN